MCWEPGALQPLGHVDGWPGGFLCPGPSSIVVGQQKSLSISLCSSIISTVLCFSEALSQCLGVGSASVSPV